MPSVQRVYGEPIYQDTAYEFTLSISPKEQLDFIKHYYTFLIYQHFAKTANIITKNYVGDTEVWRENEELSTDQFTAYKKFTLKVQFGRVTDLPEILISYDGISSLLKTPVSKLNDVPSDHIKTVAYKNKLYNYKNPHPWLKQYIDQLYSKLNNPLKSHFGIAFSNSKDTNPKLLKQNDTQIIGRRSIGSWRITSVQMILNQ